MTVSLEEVIRRLMILGVPLLPAGCDLWSQDNCPDKPKAVEELVEIARPNENADAAAVTQGVVTPAAYESCVTSRD